MKLPTHSDFHDPRGDLSDVGEEQALEMAMWLQTILDLDLFEEKLCVVVLEQDMELSQKPELMMAAWDKLPFKLKQQWRELVEKGRKCL